MTDMHRNALTWVLTGGTFLMVASTAGCGKFKAMFARGERGGGSAVIGAPAAAPRDTTTGEFADRDVESASPAPVVNIFGELDGVQRKNVALVGDVAFQQHTFADEGFDCDVAIDPAGKWMVFASTRHALNSNIYLQRVDGLSVTQLTADAADDAYPCFGPDGKHVAFSSTRSGNWDLYVMDIDGRNIVQVTSGPSQDIHPSFSPDGTRLVYSSMSSRSDQWELWTVNLSTSERRMIGYGLFPAWSPRTDKDQIAFQRARQRGSRWFSLWTMDLVDGEGRRLTEVAVSSNAAIVSPSWSPDGKKLAFATIVEPAQTVTGKPKGQQDVWTIDADGTNRQRLTDGSGSNLSPCWAVDNRVYFVSDRGGHDSVWSARMEAGSASGIAETEGAGADQAVGSADAGEVAH